MDAEGIEIAVIYGTSVMFHCNATDDARYAQALCRAWNDWAGEYCAANPERLKFAALVPLGDMGAAVEEAQHAVRDLGAVGINVAPTISGGRWTRRTLTRCTRPCKRWTSRSVCTPTWAPAAGWRLSAATTTG